MDVGRIKIPVRQQRYRDSNEFTGNKYFVLKGLKPGDKERLADSFDFWDEAQGINRKMWLSWFGKRRSCKHCKKYHDGECSLMAMVKKKKKKLSFLAKQTNK